MTYQYSRTVKLPFEEVMSKVREALNEHGFSMITTIDVHDHMGSELGVDFRNYSILSACIPELSYRAISLEPHIGILLPCTIVVQEHENRQTEVSAMNPMESLDKNMITPSLETLATEISTRLRTAIDTIETKKESFSFAW